MRLSIAILTLFLGAGAAWGQGSIRLRHLAIVEPDSPVTLGMIADLEGDALALADVEIIESPMNELAGGERPGEVDIDRVRAALKRSGRCDFSAVLLRGSTCAVRPSGYRAPLREDRDSAAPRQLPTTANVIPLTTLKGHVAASIARALHADPADVRLTFDPRDARLLAMTAVGRTVDAGVIGISDEMPVRITLYERDRIVLSEAVRVGVSVRRQVCVLTNTLRRDGAIQKEDFGVEHRWLRPTEEPIDAAEAVGLASKSKLKAGDPLLREHATQPLVVERGDMVTVHCVSGSIIVQMPARALKDGRDGELIEFEHLNDKRTFLARMSGKGRAVVAPEVYVVNEGDQP